MVLAWTLFKPAAVITAKFARHLAPGRKPACWYSHHIGFSVVCFLLTIGGLISIAVYEQYEDEDDGTSEKRGSSHIVVGYLLVVLAVIEFASAWFLRKDPGSGTPAGKVLFHKVRRLLGTAARRAESGVALTLSLYGVVVVAGHGLSGHVPSSCRRGEWLVHRRHPGVDEAGVRVHPSLHHAGSGVCCAPPLENQDAPPVSFKDGAGEWPGTMKKWWKSHKLQHCKAAVTAAVTKASFGACFPLSYLLFRCCLYTPVWGC